MPALKYGAEVLNPVTMPLPKLQRSASVPELGYNFSSSQPSSCPYEVGKMIRLCLDNRVVNAEIIKLFSPFTMAPAMIIRIYAPHMTLTGDFVLKVYDRSCTVECREEHDLPDWSIERDMEFMKSQFNASLLEYVCSLIHSDSHEEYSADEELWTQEVIDEDSIGFDGCELEEFKVEHGMLKMYSHELEFYRRAREHGIDGEDVPRFFSTVRIPHGYTSRPCPVTNDSVDGIPGILIQYIPGIPLSVLHVDPSPSPARSLWRRSIDESLQSILNITQNLGASNVDICPRNTVVHWDPIAKFWKCKFIDFGQCCFQSRMFTDAEWRLQYGTSDEEGKFAWELVQRLKHHKDFDYMYEPSDFFRQVT